MQNRDDSFDGWLRDQGATAYAALTKLAETQSWPTVTSLVQAWHLIDAANGLTPENKANLKEAASLAYVDFERSRNGRRQRVAFRLTPFGIGVFCFMGLTLLILAVAMFESSPIINDKGIPLLERLADIEAARGLITFVFTVGVIALALIIVTSSVTSQQEDKVELERAREILMTLVAIMGTILGFYFGKADGAPPPPPETEQTEPGASEPDAGTDPAPDGEG